MNLAHNLLLLILVTTIPFFLHSAVIVRFREIHCTGDGKNLKFPFCFIKTISKKTYTINIALETVKKMSVIMVKKAILRSE